MGIQSNINSGISTLSYILSLGKKFQNQDEKITENEKDIDKNFRDISDTKADIHATDEEGNSVLLKNLTKKPFDPFDKYIADFKSKLSADEIALLDAQDSKKPGSTRNLVDNYIRSKIKYEKGTQLYRDRAEKLMSNATKEDLEDPKFMQIIKRYEKWGTTPYITQSKFLSIADKENYFDSPEERAELFSSGVDTDRFPILQKKQEKATNTASDRLKMDVENKMKQESLKEERRNILQNMNTDLNNTPRGDM